MRHERPHHRHSPNREVIRVITTRTEVATSVCGNEKLFAVTYPGQRASGYVIETYAAGQFVAERAFGIYKDMPSAVSAFLGTAGTAQQETTESEVVPIEDTQEPHAPAFLQVSATAPPMMKGKSAKLLPPKPPSPQKVRPRSLSSERSEGGGRKAVAQLALGLTTRQ